MSNLFTKQGADFDHWFGISSNNSQTFQIYGEDGQDIGAKYTAGSGGPAVGWYTQAGQDLCEKLGGYGYGLYRVGGYPWNYYHSDFNWSTHYNYWKSWLTQWATKKYSCKCVSDITNDSWNRSVNSDYHYSCCVFGYAPNHSAIDFTWKKANLWSDCGKHWEFTMGLIEIAPYLKGVVLRPSIGAGDEIVAELKVTMSQSGSPTVNYDGVYGIINDDNNPTTAYYGRNKYIFGRSWYFHL